MERKNRLSQDDWSSILSEWQKSGKSQRGYCRVNGISFSAFTYWRKKLDGNNGETSLVKVRHVWKLPVINGNILCAKAGGIQVELTGQESEEQLVRIFKALKVVS
jgi:hypothetical protein